MQVSKCQAGCIIFRLVEFMSINHWDFWRFLFGYIKVNRVQYKGSPQFSDFYFPFTIMCSLAFVSVYHMNCQMNTYMFVAVIWEIIQNVEWYSCFCQALCVFSFCPVLQLFPLLSTSDRSLWPCNHMRRTHWFLHADNMGIIWSVIVHGILTVEQNVNSQIKNHCTQAAFGTFSKCQ